MKWRLTVKGQLDRKRLPGCEIPFLVSECQAPTGIGIDRDGEIDSAGIGRTRCAVRKIPGLIVGVCAALPVADIDGSEGPTGLCI
jgi:hypothetical protein